MPRLGRYVNNMAKLEKITFQPEGDNPVEFYVLEQTRINGCNLILKDMSKDGEEESVFSIVSDDNELAAVAGVFENMLEDVEFVRD